MNKERHAYSIMVVPEREGSAAFSFRISRRRVIFIAVCVGLAVIGMGILIFKSVQAGRKLSYFYALNLENEELKKENSNLRLIQKKIGRMDTLASYLSALASLRNERSDAGFVESTAVPGEMVVSGGTEAKTTTDNKTAVRADTSGKGSVVIENDSASIPSILPVEGWITQNYIDETKTGSVRHLGVDIAAAEGKSIKAPAAGVVSSITNDRYYGILLVIKHQGGYQTRYGHCQKVFVGVGDSVQANQTIALVGNTGHSTAPHVHYEVLKNGKNINPMNLVSSGKK